MRHRETVSLAPHSETLSEYSSPDADLLSLLKNGEGRHVSRTTSMRVKYSGSFEGSLGKGAVMKLMSQKFGAALLMSTALLINVGCASENQGDPAAATVAAVPPRADGTPVDANGDGIPDAPMGTGNTPAQSGYSSGSTVTFNANVGSLRKMFYQSNPPSPTNIRINIDLTRKQESVIISFVDRGYIREAALGVQHPYDSHVNEQYNGWVNINGQSVYKGFFQDQYGAIVLVLDRALSQGDGQAGTILGGSVYFQNFYESPYQAPYQGPLKMCWEISRGPYDCRTFLISGAVNMLKSLYPAANDYGTNRTYGYEKLGDFDGMNRQAMGL